VPEEYFHHIGLFQRFRQRLAYQMIRVLFFLFTFYFRQEKETGPSIAKKKRRAKR
jgi:hypothetical protein